VQKVKNLFGLNESKTRAIGLQLGLLKGRTDFTRFIILGRSRTGSNFLRGLISSHPAVLSMGEIFRNRDEIDFDHPDYRVSDKVLELYKSDPAAFLETVVFRKVPVQYQAVGFKLFYYHARKPPYLQLWQYLEQHPEIRIVHIKRRNMLHTHLSRAKAEQSGVWVNINGVKEDQSAVNLNYDDCLKDFQQTLDWETWADTYFKNHPLTQVYYEDLAADYPGHAARLQQFLGLKEMLLEPSTHKQSNAPLSAAIQNYAELKARFAGSQWAGFFEE